MDEHTFVHDPNHKGNVAEAEIAAAAVGLGVPVLRPQVEHERFDLAFEIGHELLRVQCKGARLDQDRSVVIVDVGCSWYGPRGYVITTYDQKEIDLLAVYCGELDRVYLLPAELVAGKQEIYLRLTPPAEWPACVH